MTDAVSDATDGSPRHADAGLLSPTRAGTPAEATTSDDAWLQAMLDAEAGLVRAQSRLGLVPGDAARAITALARAEHLDVVEIARLARGAANPVVALVRAFTALVASKDPAAAEYVHRGSTSQDIMDTAAMLVARRTLAPLVADLERIAVALRELAVAHRDTLMPGRTLALHAVPTTFGLKAAGWLSGVEEAAARLARIRDHELPVQLGGAAGTLAGYTEYALMDRGTRPRAPGPGEFAERLTAEFAAQVGLNEPALPWHTARTPVAGLAAQLALTTGALGKVAVDVQLLSRTETAEVAEPAAEGRGVSSAMPHKRNPALATLVRSAALQVPPLAGAVMGCMLAEDERPAGAWHAEWLPLRECLRLTGGAAHTAVELVEGLAVFPDRMRANLGLTGGLIVSERLAAALTPVLGKGPAKELMSRASAEAARGGRTLGEVLAAAPELEGRYTPRELAALLDPANYPGAAGPLVDRAVRGPRGRF
ncbi:3-carboxy-cis,cis-muconate cycloisomerase [Streptomyces sp. SID8382]|uniref:3-carboxy-cis,cis-muconate cycloisomerase n=1 Tax=Streptomyces malaysiensis TaxID=92644 RepID=UPI000C2BB2BF|nr:MULTISPECIES: 3-carboxy-cis,cis-muconate cycloisomerase [unclassified Streptomyces]AUA14840.1 3-carboxy-cis,cis-muconate cycloisomerase [Streptomyces sp. M56]MYX55795.1 3-carboxy-cis,cis-muconate cycloisomerase [Streptomyces sp. SID8382]